MGTLGQGIDLPYPFIQPEGGLLMSGKVGQTSLITKALLAVVVLRLVAVMYWRNMLRLIG